LWKKLSHGAQLPQSSCLQRFDFLTQLAVGLDAVFLAADQWNGGRVAEAVSEHTDLLGRAFSDAVRVESVLDSTFLGHVESFLCLRC
jgi:hypothetical protein